METENGNSDSVVTQMETENGNSDLVDKYVSETYLTTVLSIVIIHSAL